MPDPTPEQRLLALRRRWESERTPTASVSLAEEYRRLGRHQDARSVLESSLKSFPQHLSALVALGRVRLEAGDAGGAAQVLERVLERDPMQLVANKMLAEAYLALGRPTEAEQRLRIYALLNERDPELAALRRRLRQAQSQDGASTPAAETVAVPVQKAVPPVPPLRAVRSDPEDLVFDLPPLDVPAPRLSTLGPPAARPAPARSVGAERPQSRDGGEVFAGLASTWAVARYRQAMGAGEVFRATALPPASLAPAPVAPAPVATATLGGLYLRQGHRREAEGIFSAVLRQDPWNESARLGLRAARAEPSETPGGVDPRVARLRSYLERLRRARPERDAPFQRDVR